MSISSLSQREFEFLSDAEFLLTKQQILGKVMSWLRSCSALIDEEIGNGNYSFNPNYLSWASKISKGENYRGLPYIVLDNPRFFTKDAVLSYRILLWWGNIFSFSLHLEGPGTLEASESIVSKMEGKVDEEIYFCVGKTPWEYHFEKSNYILLNTLSVEHVRTHFSETKFLKVTKKATLNEWPSLNDLAIRNLQVLTELTNLGRQS